MREKLAALPLLVLLCCGFLHAQQWSGIITPTRAAPWARASVGVSGGIPSSSWPQCGSTIAAYGAPPTPPATVNTGNSATINNAIASCGGTSGSPGYVLLGCGEFYLNGSVIIQHSWVVLRGSLSGGYNCTNLTFTSPSECVQISQDLAICGGDNSPFLYPGKIPYTQGSSTVAGGGSYTFNWTGGYSQGATSITVATVGSAGIVNGDIITLDQANDQNITNNGNLICDVGPSSGAFSFQCNQQSENGPPGYGGTYSGRTSINGVDYTQEQSVRVTAGCATTCTGAGPFTLTISPGLYANNWNENGTASGYFVKATNLTMAGFEQLTLTNTSAGSNIGVSNTDGWWLKGIASSNGDRNHVWSTNATHGEIRDSYFWWTENGLIESYGVELPDGSDNLIENNIFQGIASPFIGGGGESGNIYAFNYSINNYYTGASGSYMQAAYMCHDSGNSFNLYEGNQMNGLFCDDVHGSSSLATAFRDWLNGRDFNTAGSPPYQPTAQTYPIDLNSYARGFNFIGMVLGTPGYHNNYTAATPNSANCNTSILVLGWGGDPCDGSGGGGVLDDTQVANTVFAWGNYDVASGSVVWTGAYDSPGASMFIGAQSVPSSHTLPCSFYYSGCSSPSWFTVVSGTQAPWPPVGPDVSGGSGPGGYAYIIPAANCYLNIMGGATNGSGGPYQFSSPACYGASGPPPTEPVVSLSPTSGSFTLSPGGSGNITVTLQNTGTGNLVMTSTAISGSSLYTISSNTCTGTITPTSTCTTTVHFAPTLATQPYGGLSSATLTYTDNASPATQTVVFNGNSVVSPPGPPPVHLTAERRMSWKSAQP